MLEFYEFNNTNICMLLISIFIIYYLLSNFINFDKKEKDKKTEFSIEYLIISIILSVIISMIIAYIMSSGEENILTDNYWDPID